nr:odorant receptor 45 [Graphosoma rubrolineatum]
MFDPVKIYFNLLIKSFSLVTGEETMSTWTFHKGLLRLLGNDWLVRKGEISLLRIIWLVLYPIMYIMSMVSITTLTIKYVLQREHPTMQEYTRAMNGVVACIAFVYAICKSLVLKLLGKNLRLLMDMTDDLGPVDEVATPHRDRSVRHATLYLGLLCLIPTTWTICSMFYMHNIPFPTDWPWGDHTPFRYFISFSIDFVAATYCAVTHSTYDTIFPVCAGAICGHIASISAKMEKLGTTGDKEKDKKIITECYRLHVALLRISDHINNTFGLVFLIQSIYTVLHACVIIYQVMKVSDITLAVLNTAPILASSYAQFLLYCYYGELLTDFFERLRFAFYNNRWYQCDMELKKMLVIMTLAANRTVRLESYGITFAGHKTYVSGLQDSISYYLILKTVTTDT